MHHVKHRTEGQEDKETPNSVSSDRMKQRTKDNRQKTTAQTRVLTARSKTGIVPEIKGTQLFVSSSQCMSRLREVMLMVWHVWATDHSRQYY